MRPSQFKRTAVLGICTALCIGSTTHAQGGWRRVLRQQPETWYQVYPWAVGDVDGDRDIDIIAGGGLRTFYLIRNAGPAGFLAETEILPAFSATAVLWTVRLVDSDADGDLDLFLFIGDTGVPAGDPAMMNRLLLNDGTGAFTEGTASRWPTGAYSTVDGLVEDLNHDGILDIVEVNYGWPHQLFFGQPGGTFVNVTTTHLPPSRNNGWKVAAGDLDGDNAKDLVITWGGSVSANPGNMMFLNDGTGHFTDVSSRLAGRVMDTGVAIGDVDGDGDNDLALGVNSWPNAPADQRSSTILRNDGLGFFVADPTSIPPANYAPWYCDFHTKAEFVDLDQDGDLDLLMRSQWPRRIFLNDGLGRFTDGENLLQVATPYGTDRFLAADMDLDGDLDLVNYSASDIHLHSSIARHVSAAAAPRIGQNYVIDHDGMPGGAALLALSAATILVPLSGYGNLQIDPSFAFFWPAPAMLDNTGSATTTIPVPNDQALVGVQLYLQTLVQSRPNGAVTLSNAYRETIVR